MPEQSSLCSGLFFIFGRKQAIRPACYQPFSGSAYGARHLWYRSRMKSSIEAAVPLSVSIELFCYTRAVSKFPVACCCKFCRKSLHFLKCRDFPQLYVEVRPNKKRRLLPPFSYRLSYRKGCGIQPSAVNPRRRAVGKLRKVALNKDQ